MHNRENWQIKNEQYLAAAIRWLRRLLSGKAQLEDVTATDVAQAEMEMVAAAAFKPPPAFITLGRQLGLSSFEGKYCCCVLPWNCSSKFPIFVLLYRGSSSLETDKYWRPISSSYGKMGSGFMVKWVVGNK